MWVVLIIYLAVMSVHAFVSPGSAQLVLRSSHRARGTTVVQYKVEKNGNKDDGGDEQRPASGWKRFIPGVVRNRLDKRAPDPEMDSSNRYQLRLVRCQAADRRHATTRLLRFLPDLKWETAEGIVDASIHQGSSLVRVYNSLPRAEETHSMLQRADPPVVTEVYDTRKDEVIVW